MSPVLAQLLVLPLLLQSIGGYAWLAWHLRRRHGQVRADALGFPDLLASAGLGFILVQLVLVSLKQRAPLTPGMTLTVTQILAAPLPWLLVDFAVLGSFLVRRISVVEFFGLRRVELWRAVLWAVPLVVLAFPSILFVTTQVQQRLLGPESITEQLPVTLFRNELQRGAVGPLATFFIATVVLAPIAEELLFRGYLYAVGKRYFGAVGSAVACAAFFALVHVNAASFAGLFVLALALTLAYERTGSLLVPILMHATFNATNLAVLAFQSLQRTP